jgi:DNA polymerase-3 subunit alpha
MAAKFVPLHVHSHYSLLNALPKIPELVARAKEEGCEALALTDLGNLYGAIEFYKECKKQGIKPIIGLDANLGEGKRLLIYAQNNEGYQNLLALVTKSHLASPGNPIVSSEMLHAHKQGLITLEPQATDIALPEIYYLTPEDRRAWETLRAIEHGAQEGGDIDTEDADYSFPTGAQMSQRFSEAQIAKTREIAEQCTVELALGAWIFPPLTLPEGTTADQELLRLAKEGLSYRKLKETPEVTARLQYEHKIIADKGFAPYFLVVADLLRFARENKILATTRGSAGGSLISYLTGITTIDPLAYKLPFERFLNPERPKAPDIDMDFADDRRDEVVEYARKKYGADHMAQIGTFGTMLARGVVRDVARALGYPYGLGDRIAKEIPLGSQGFPMTLGRALRENNDLKKMYETEAEVKEIIDLGKKIEGNARHISVHAAGVVISPEPLIHYSPLQLDPKGGKLITQYDMYSITDEYGGVGLLKFDFLGIRNLAILAHAVELAQTTRGVRIDLEQIPLDDKKTFEMLARGETEATFQLNGSGMTRYLKELKPTTIDDINAMVALFRPGPMEMIPSYIERKHNPARIEYLDPRMKEILDRSYGVITYQDDVLLIAVKIAGYSWLEADALRKAMGKKIPVEMEAQKEKFISGAIKNGLAKERANRLWKLIEPFAAYGFNKAHAASYGKVAYQTAYMKANFPLEYMASVLTAEAGDVDTIATMVSECKRMGIAVLPPDVNESFGNFTVITKAEAPSAGGIGSIRFGLYSIKNFGRGVADSIIAERKRGGKFVSLSDFLRRIKDQNLNKKGLESLIKCGALDSLGERGQMLAHIELLLMYHRDLAREQSHDSLFTGLGSAVEDVRLPPAAPAELPERLVWEKELLGLYVSGHPLEPFKEKLKKGAKSIKELREIPPGIQVVTGGLIEKMRIQITKQGDQMAFVTLADFDGSMDVAIFPRTFAEYKQLLKPDSCIALKGRLSNRNGELSLVAEQLKAL